jgi:Putative transposase, YhgA-like
MGQDHDALFRYTFSQPDQAAALLRSLLPPVLVTAIDWERIRPVPGSFVDGRLAAHFADLLFEAPVHGVSTLLYALLEHKSAGDRWTTLQLLRYQVRIYERWLDEHPGAELLPPILPIVVHHGPAPWTEPRRLRELIDLGSLSGDARRLLAELQPEAAFLLDDLARAEEDQLRQRDLPPLGRLSLLLLQFVHAVQATEPAQLTRRWRGLFRALWLEPLTRGHLLALFSYLGRRLEAPPESLRTAAAVIDPEAESMGKTIAEQLIQQGRLDGQRAGMQEGRAAALRDCIRMLLAYRPSQPVALTRIDTADASTLERWLSRLIAGEDIDRIVDDPR